jgi:hypothetical protein
MGLSVKWLVLTFIIFGALIGLLESFAAVLLKPDRGDLLALAGFLVICGGITLGVSIAVARSGLPSWIHSIRTQLLLISVVVAVLVVVNIGFISYLMFISTHDLILLILPTA